MRPYAVTKFAGVEPKGNTAGIVVAKHEHHARKLFNAELEKQGLPPLSDTNQAVFTPIATHEAKAIILTNGNY